MKGLSVPIALRYDSLTKNNQKTRKSTNSTTKGPAYPPAFSPSVQVDKTFRFRCTAAGTYTITMADIGDLHCFATAANVAYQLGRCFRIRKVEIWARESGDPVTCSAEWTSTAAGSTGPSRVISDTSSGTARPAHIRVKPPKTSGSSLWLSSGAATAFLTLVLPDEATIDVSYSYVMYETTVGAAVTGAVAGATAGTVYVRALNSSVSQTALPPISYQTI